MDERFVLDSRAKRLKDFNRSQNIISHSDKKIRFWDNLSETDGRSAEQ